MSNFNCCFLTCIQISQEAGQVAWYSYLLKNFPQFVVIHTVKGLGIVNKAEMDVFLELSCFFDDPAMLAIWSLVPLPFLKPAWTSGSSRFRCCWSLAWNLTQRGLFRVIFFHCVSRFKSYLCGSVCRDFIVLYDWINMWELGYKESWVPKNWCFWTVV